MRWIFITCFSAFAGFAGWTSPAGAGLFSATGPVIAILAGDLFTGEAEGNLDGSGTIKIQSRSRPELTCHGRFTSSAELGGAGNLQCSNAATATFTFQRLSIRSGFGTGTFTGEPMSFTYGLTANESEPHLKLPAGKALRSAGKDLVLVDLVQPDQVINPVKISTASAPDMLLREVTMAVTAKLKQYGTIQASSPEKIAELVESTILPLFNFRRMTQLALGANWRLASPEQQNALIVEFKSLLVRTYSTALANYRDQAIEYRPLRMTAGETTVTVNSMVKQPGAERITLDYDMEKMASGWKVYDIKIGGISLITTYRSTFAETIRNGGVDSLIQTLAAKNRGLDSGRRSDGSGVRSPLLLYTVIPAVARGGAK